MGSWVSVVGAAVVVGLFFVALIRDMRKRYTESGD
jgi:hypothetical protein